MDARTCTRWHTRTRRPSTRHRLPAGALCRRGLGCVCGPPRLRVRRRRPRIRLTRSGCQRLGTKTPKYSVEFITQRKCPKARDPAATAGRSRITGHPAGGPLPAEPTQAFAAAGVEAGPGHKRPATNGMPRRRRLPQPAAFPLSSVRPPCGGRLMCADVGHEFMFTLTESCARKAGHFRRCIVSSQRTGKKKSGNNTNCRGHITTLFPRIV